MIAARASALAAYDDDHFAHHPQIEERLAGVVFQAMEAVRTGLDASATPWAARARLTFCIRAHLGRRLVNGSGIEVSRGNEAERALKEQRDNG